MHEPHEKKNAGHLKDKGMVKRFLTDNVVQCLLILRVKKDISLLGL